MHNYKSLFCPVLGVMCLSTLPPGVARMRHWSCPERLSSLSEAFSPPLAGDPLLSIKKSKEAEDWQAGELKLRVLAPWEERVLLLRELRRSKRRQDCETSENCITDTNNQDGQTSEDCITDTNNQDGDEVSSSRNSDFITSENSLVGPSCQEFENVENEVEKMEKLDLKCDEKYPELCP